jgi:hypothetical protein
MRNRWLEMLLCLAFVVVPQACCAEQFAGMLVRVDLHSVTLRGSDNERCVMRVEQRQRRQAAPYLGRWVMVDFKTVDHSRRVIRFRPPK